MTRDHGEPRSVPRHTPPHDAAQQAATDVAAGDAPPTAHSDSPRSGTVDRLYRLYHHRVHAFLRRMTDSATADDLTQETFVRLMHVADLETRPISVSYLIKIADNLLKRHRRRDACLEKYLDQMISTATATAAAHPGREAGAAPAASTRVGASSTPLDEDLLVMLDERLRALSQPEHEAVRMIVCSGMSYREAASAIGSRVTTVNNWRHRGLERLRREPDMDRPPRATTAAARSRVA